MRTLIIMALVLALTGCVANRINYASVRIETMGDNASVQHRSQPQSLNADKQYSDVMNPKTNVDSVGGRTDAAAK